MQENIRALAAACSWDIIFRNIDFTWLVPSLMRNRGCYTKQFLFRVAASVLLCNEDWDICQDLVRK